MSTPAIVTESLAFYRTASSAEDKQRQREKEDLACQTPEGIWPEDVRQSRGKASIGGIPIPPRPMLSVATMDEPIQLVLNQEKAAHLGVNIHPLTEDASDDTAEVMQDLYRQIETDSRANLARDWAFDRSTKAGRGVYEVRAEYDHDTGVPGDQKLVIKRLLYQTAVYFDPFAQEPDWSDGERALVVEDMPVTTYKRRFGKSELAGLDDRGLVEIGTQQADWIGGDGPESRTIRLAKYYYVEHSTESVDAGGRTFEKDKRTVKCCLHNAVEILEQYEWGGQYIPLIPTIGRELQPFDGERRWVGMIHNAKDGARLTNYAASGAVEIASLEPKAPFLLDPETIEGYNEFWENANVRNFPYLPFHRSVNGQTVAPPARVQIDVSRLGPNMALLSMGRDFVQAATATFDPALGKQPTAHRSGRAIVALQDQTVEGTSHYVANLADISMTYEAMVIIDAMPYYYDRPGRILTIRDAMDRQRRVMVNAPHTVDPQTGKPVPVNGGPPPPDVKNFDLKKGRYGITVTISKSYKSRLEQGQNELGDILSSSPELMPIIGPEYFKFRDTPGGQEISALLKKMRDHTMPWLSDDPNVQQGSLPQLQQENAALKQQLQEASQIIQTDQIKQQAQMAIAAGKDQTTLEVHRQDNEAKMAVALLGAKVETLQNAMNVFMEERARLGSQAHDVGLAGQDHAHTMQQADQAHQQALQAGAQDTMAQGGLAEQGHAQTLEQGAQQHGQALEANQQQADLAPPPTTGANA